MDQANDSRDREGPETKNDYLVLFRVRTKRACYSKTVLNDLKVDKLVKDNTVAMKPILSELEMSTPIKCQLPFQRSRVSSILLFVIDELAHK